MLHGLLTAMSVTEDLIVPLTLVVVASGVGFFWPWFQSYHRGRRFRYLIRRELAEASPVPADPNDPVPWSERMTKDFLHRKIIEDVSENRDFILSLDADLVYQVTQLWDALKTKDHIQWMYCLGTLTESRARTPDLKTACTKWGDVMDVQHPGWFKEVSRGNASRSLFERAFGRVS